MAILTTVGRNALATAVLDQVLHLAWGTGSSAWDTTPVAESVSATGLVAEVGRRTVQNINYCIPDAGGSIVLPSGTFALSGIPTNYLYIDVTFDYLDASTSSIREIGLFAGTVVSGALPGTQHYYQPGDIVSPGTLMYLQNITKIARSSSIRQEFKFVLKF